MHDESHNFSFETEGDKENLELPVLEETDLYLILNVSQNADQLEIQNSYKKLSRIYHPDKHSLIKEDYQSAQVHFTKIKEAYDILSCPTKRAVYDMYGMKGIKMESWEVVERPKNPNELQMIYESHRKMVEDDLMNRITRPETCSTFGIDLSDVFDRYLKEETNERYLRPSANFYKTELRHSVCLGMTTNDTVNLSGVCSVKNGIGKGELIASWRRFLYPRFQNTWFDIQTSVSTDSEVSGGVIVSRKIFDKFTCSVGTSVIMPSFGYLAPGIQTSISWQITNQLFGKVDYKWNLDSKVHSQIGWQSQNGNHNIYLGANISARDSYFSIYYDYILHFSQWRSGSNKFNKAQEAEDWAIDERREPVNFKIGGRYGISSVYARFGISRRVTKFSTFGISLSLGLPLGVMAKFKIIRGNQTYIFPIIMSEEIDPAASFYGSLVPLAIFFAIKNLLYDPWKKKELEKELIKRRQIYISELKRRRAEAFSAQSLMSESSKRSYQQESAKNGLIIENAVYGRLTKIKLQGDYQRNTVDQSENNPLTTETIDVTIPLQVLVDKSKLQLPICRPGNTRAQMQGFYDPCLGLLSTVETVSSPNSSSTGGDSFLTSNGIRISSSQRQLYVRYRFKDKLHEVVVGDNEELLIPLESHIVAP